MSAKYYAPKFQEAQFHCPLCEVFAHQLWSDGTRIFQRDLVNPPIHISTCQACNGAAIWINGILAFPASSTAPLPHADLSGAALATYVEARSIVVQSPRASSALLRRCLEELIDQLDVKGADLDKRVGNLVAAGMPSQIQKAMDTLRVIGNESIHPGTIDVRDDPEIAIALFELVNLIVETMITQPKRVNKLYEGLPDSKRMAVEKRDSGK